MTGLIIFLILIAYSLGAIPFAIVIGKIFYHRDVRKEGSGNAGATNTFRVLGAKAGIIVLLLDMLKGIAAVLLSRFINPDAFSSPDFLYLQMVLGAAAAIGHIFPVYLRLKGGKGVATFFGVILYLFPIAAVICMIIFFITFFITHFVSLSSMLASVAFALVLFFAYNGDMQKLPLICFAIAIPVIIIYTHRKNIQRLLNGTESRLSFSKPPTSI